jgi:hypothetical protein
MRMMEALNSLAGRADRLFRIALVDAFHSTSMHRE